MLPLKRRTMKIQVRRVIIDNYDFCQEEGCRQVKKEKGRRSRTIREKKDLEKTGIKRNRKAILNACYNLRGKDPGYGCH